MPFRLPESSVLNLSKNICREEGSESRSAPATASRARYPSSTTAACRRCARRPATARSAHASAERYARTERLLGEQASQGAHTKRTHNAQPPARPHARLHIPACCRAPRGPTPPERRRLPEGRSGLIPPSITPPRPSPRSSATEGALRALGLPAHRGRGQAVHGAAASGPRSGARRHRDSTARSAGKGSGPRWGGRGARARKERRGEGRCVTAPARRREGKGRERRSGACARAGRAGKGAAALT